MNELWNSLESLGRLNSYLQLAVAVTGVLTAILGGLIWIASERLAVLEDTQKRELQNRVQTAESDAAEARREAQAVAAKQRPRALTQDQQSTLLGLLGQQPKGDVLITAVMSDPEAERFALQLYELFKKAGWNPKGVNLAMMSPAPSGVFLKIKDKEAPPAHAGLVQAALAAAQVEAPCVIDAKLDGKLVGLLVGHKP
jgi:hypothetical protein